MITITIESDKQGEGKSIIANHLKQICEKRLPYAKTGRRVFVSDEEDCVVLPKPNTEVYIRVIGVGSGLKYGLMKK